MAFPIAAFLSTAIGPLAKKVLAALGFGTLTYAGLDAAFSAAQTQVIQHYGGLPSAALQIADLAGVGASIGIILGALASRVGLAVLSRYTKLL